MPRNRAHLRRIRIVLSVLVGLAALALYQAAVHRDMPLGWSAARLEEVHRSALPPSIDADRDGLRDAEEQALAARYAPVVTLHAADSARPASVTWLLARTGRLGAKDGLGLKGGLGGYGGRVRRGSSDPADWVTYVHVYPAREEGGVLIQYWFYYPFSDGPLLLGHEGDWEHVTVELQADRRPLGVWAARHQDNAPGRFRGWSRIRKLNGTHPEILSARGTHASYFDLADVPWYDRAGRCPDLTGPCEHPRWRTWEGGGLRHLGERQAPFDLVSMTHAGRWGLSSVLPGRSAPFGPAFQRGWCAGGAPGCGMYGAY